MIAWLDLETTGTDEDAPKARILEIGTVFTNEKLEEVQRFQLTINPGRDIGPDPDESAVREELVRIWEAMDPYVRNMHTENGLWKNVQQSVVSTAQADTFFSEYLDYFFQRHAVAKVKLAGSGVSWFDLQWIREFLPKSAERFDRGPIDIGVLRRYLRDIVGYDVSRADPDGTSGVAEKKRHRALDDAKAHLEEARFYMELLQGALPLGPAEPVIRQSVEALGNRMRGMQITRAEADHLRQHIAIAERL